MAGFVAAHPTGSASGCEILGMRWALHVRTSPRLLAAVYTAWAVEVLDAANTPSRRITRPEITFPLSLK
ncbi:hypothetical protein E4U53_003105 [Claviceps sorghi]|nr:hypothetical protein E4U53_003105 [Claviceps sorghi]